MGARFGLAHHTDPRSTVTTPVYFFGFKTWNTPPDSERLRALVFLRISPLFSHLISSLKPLTSSHYPSTLGSILRRLSKHLRISVCLSAHCPVLLANSQNILPRPGLSILVVLLIGRTSAGNISNTLPYITTIHRDERPVQVCQDVSGSKSAS